MSWRVRRDLNMNKSRHVTRVISRHSDLCDMTWIRKSHVTHMNASSHTHEWITSHTYDCHIAPFLSHLCARHDLNMNESCHTNECVVMNESCHTDEWVMSHKWMSHVTQMNEWVMSHKWMSHVTQMNASCMCDDAFICVTWFICHTNECVVTHIWMNHVTHIWMSFRAIPIAPAWNCGGQTTRGRVGSQLWMGHVTHE